MEQYSKVQQLMKKEDGHKDRKPVYPPTVIQAVFDAKTGASLEAILAQFNSIYVQYQGTPKDTRLVIPMEMRRAGLTITYMNMDSETITERASSAVQKDNDHWGLDTNWSRVDELSLSGDIAVSASGTWIINGEDTGVKAVGPKGDTGATGKPFEYEDFTEEQLNSLVNKVSELVLSKYPTFDELSNQVSTLQTTIEELTERVAALETSSTEA